MNAVQEAEIESLREAVNRLQFSLDRISASTDAALRLAKETRSLIGPFGVALPDGTMLVQTIYGIKYLIDPSDRIMAPQLIVYRQWEPDLSRLFVSSLSPCSVVVDVGANFGYFTCLAANTIGTNGNGQVWAFEPNPRLIPLLEDNCWRINWSMAPVHLRPAAVGAASGRASLSVPRNGAANASLTDNGWDGERVDVDVVALDEAIPPDIAVDLMKIDVEGHEMSVLLGAQRLIARSPNLHILMEWSLGQLQAAGTDVHEFLRYLEEIDLVTMSIPESGTVQDAQPFESEKLHLIPYANIILRKRGRC